MERDVVEFHPSGEDLDLVDLVDDPPATVLTHGPGTRLAHAADEVRAIAVGRPRLRQVLRRKGVPRLPIIRPSARREAHRPFPPRSAKKLMIAAAPPITSAAAADISAPERPRADQWWLLPCEASAHTPAPIRM